MQTNPDYEMHLRPEEDYEMHFDDAGLKPEQTATVTPDYETQTVRPDPGCVFSEVTVEAIPEPTEEIDITENGVVDVARYGTANVAVPVGVFPEGTKVITQNVTGVDVTNYEKVDVAVPEYDDGGWGREVGAPNLNLLRQPGRECSSGSGNHVLFMSYYQPNVMANPENCRIAISDKPGLQNVEDVTLNADGTYIINKVLDKNSSYYTVVNTIGWHLLRFEFNTANANLVFYISGGCYQIEQSCYEVISCGLNFIPKYKFSSCCIVDSVLPNLNNAFASNGKLKNVTFVNCDSSNVTSMNGMMSGCGALEEVDLSMLDTSNVVSMKNMFNSCYSLKNVNMSSFDTSSVTDIYGMFLLCYCIDFVDFSTFNMSAMTIMTCFGSTKMLQKIIFPDGNEHQYPASGTALKTWIASPETSVSSNFTFLNRDSYSMKDVVNFPIIHCSFIFSPPQLSIESLMVIINALPEVETSQTVTIGATNIAKLTADQIAIAQDKGWTVT